MPGSTRHRDDWQQLVEPGQKILVCDIGGGTSDFTLIRVRLGEDQKAALPPHRRRRTPDPGRRQPGSGPGTPSGAAAGGLGPSRAPPVGRAGGHLPTGQRTIAGHPTPRSGTTVTLPGTGSKLIGRSLQVEVGREEVHQVLVEGFLPRVGLDDRPQSRQSGFQEFGLPFAADPAITRYLAAFLTAHRHGTVDDDPLPTDHDPARPDIVLFNGGLFESPVLQDRLVGRAAAMVWPGPHRRRLAADRSGRQRPGSGGGSRAPPITAWSAAARACASPPAWRAPTTWRDSQSPEASAVCVVPASASRDRKCRWPTGNSRCWCPSRSSSRCWSPARG